MTGDQNYRVAVVTVPSSVAIFSTGKTWTAEDLATFDYAIDLIGTPGQYGQLGGIGRGGPPRTGGRGGPQGGMYVGQGLRLLVKHEAGSLETAVSNLRMRNLAISFGILLVLGFGAGVGIVSGHRARTLGRLQMEFAAGVSHELRTPPRYSIRSNLRAGVVKDREGIEEYATIVQKEARRLSNMVEQVMTYAETQSGRKRYDIARVDLNAVVDRALQNMALPLGDANASVENRITSKLFRIERRSGPDSICSESAQQRRKMAAAPTRELEVSKWSVQRNHRLSVIDHGQCTAVDERYFSILSPRCEYRYQHPAMDLACIWSDE
jgi:hypothetical protein